MKILLSLIFLTTLINQSAQADQPNILYGEDDRLDIHQTSVDVQKLARAVAAKMSFNDYQAAISPGISSQISNYQSKKNLCVGERFSKQPVLASCTGFLIDDNHLITAAHCVDSRRCDDHVWVFDFVVTSKDGQEQTQVGNAYSCKKVVRKVYNSRSGVDYALIKLSSRVTDREPLRLASHAVEQGREIFVLGHPQGLPMKYSDNASVKRWNTNSNYFYADLDTFSINSGSPVFDERTQEVVGILARGDLDFTFNEDLNCNAERSCEYGEECSGEEVVSIDKVNTSTSLFDFFAMAN